MDNNQKIRTRKKNPPLSNNSSKTKLESHKTKNQTSKSEKEALRIMKNKQIQRKASKKTRGCL